MPISPFLSPLTLYGEQTVQSGSGDPQPFRDGNIVFHGLIYGIAADYQHMSAAEKITGNVDAVLMLLRNRIVEKQRQEQKRADRRKTGIINGPAVVNCPSLYGQYKKAPM